MQTQSLRPGSHTVLLSHPTLRGACRTPHILLPRCHPCLAGISLSVRRDGVPEPKKSHCCYRKTSRNSLMSSASPKDACSYIQTQFVAAELEQICGTLVHLPIPSHRLDVWAGRCRFAAVPRTQNEMHKQCQAANLGRCSWCHSKKLQTLISIPGRNAVNESLQFHLAINSCIFTCKKKSASFSALGSAAYLTQSYLGGSHLNARSR